MFHYTLTSLAPGGQRSKVFSEQFMQEKFQTVHERHFKDANTKLGKVPKGGYPDMGSGRYSEKLSYKDWFNFNSAQRVHYNYLEAVTPVVCWLLIAGLVYPWESIALGGGFILGRILFHIGYVVKGPKGREFGFVLGMLCTVVLFGFAIASAVKLGATLNF